MPDDYLCSIEALIAIVLGCICWRRAEASKYDGEGRIIDEPRRQIPRGDCKCPTAPRASDPAEPRDAQFVTASLVWSGTTRGETLFVPGNASIASEIAGQAIAIGCHGSNSA
jgi:hypothetical protein